MSWKKNQVEAQPALDFITQPANEAVQQKVQESLERLHHKSEPVAQVATTEVEPQEKQSLFALMCSLVVQAPFQPYHTQKQR